SRGVRKHGQDPDLLALRERQLDFGQDFLPWLVDQDLPVYAHPASRTGDIGSVVGYIDTMVAMLRGQFRSLIPLIEGSWYPERKVWIADETLRFCDDLSGKSLEEKMEEGLVEIGPNVRLGSYVEIAPGVKIVDSNIDDGVDVGEGVEIRRSAVRDGAIIGLHARISDTYVGSMVEVRSGRERPTAIEGYVGVGDEAVIQPGVRLAGKISIYPRLKIPFGAEIPDGAEIRDAEDVLRHM
ncbi:MAG: hypothetical protein ACREJP_01630, partial [Candidatus Methylomirabilales bacterium]